MIFDGPGVGPEIKPSVPPCAGGFTLGCSQNLLDRSGFRYVSILQKDDILTQSFGLAGIIGHEHNRNAACVGFQNKVLDRCR